MIIRCAKIPLLVFLIAFSFQAHSQQANMHTWFDAAITLQNTGLYSGKEYIDVDRATPENHKFFESPKFTSGSLVYHDQPYFNVALKYDVYNDVLVINLPQDVSEISFQPVKQFVSNFKIDTHKFININTVTDDQDIDPGFYEELFRVGDIALLKKHRMSKSTKMTDRVSFNQYKKAKSDYFVKKGETYEKVKSKRDIARLFPEYKDQINAINKLGNEKDETKIDAYYLSVIQNIASLQSQESNTY